MIRKDLFEYKKKYDMYRHHAWAGGILLSVFMTIRAFLEFQNISEIPNYIFLIIGLFLVLYILISISFTYKYRVGLTIQQEQKITHVNTKSYTGKKDRIKIEKKKTKAEIKKQKKRRSERN